MRFGRGSVAIQVAHQPIMVVLGPFSQVFEKGMQLFPRRGAHEIHQSLTGQREQWTRLIESRRALFYSGIDMVEESGKSGKSYYFR